MPLHHLGGLTVFGNVLLSPFLLKRCAEDGRSVVWLSRVGRFVGRLCGPVSGNVLLREAQHEALASGERRALVARQFVVGKIRGQRAVLMRAARESSGADEDAIRKAVGQLDAAGAQARECADVAEARGAEGQAAAVYFGVLHRLLSAPGMAFETRSRRPPRDPVNALLSFLYTLLRAECEAALEGVGLDPQVGFLHALRPGRPALALDLMEEFRAPLADRLALTLLNRRQLSPAHFEPRPGGAVYLNEEGRRVLLTAYQERKQTAQKHRLLKEPVARGLLPHLQARLLARHLRGDLLTYPPYRGR